MERLIMQRIILLILITISFASSTLTGCSNQNSTGKVNNKTEQSDTDTPQNSDDDETDPYEDSDDDTASNISETPADPGRQGTVNFLTSADNLDSEKYESARLYYPEYDNGPPLPATILTHGWEADKEKMTWLAERLASHGYIVILFTALAYNNLFASPSDWVTGHKGAIETLTTENLRQGSPIYHRLDTSRIAIMGHSMGGGGALHTADEVGDQVAAVIGITPYETGNKPGENITVPVLIITGSADILVSTSMGMAFYDALPAINSKLFLTIEAMGHNDVQNEGNDQYHEICSTLIVSWLNYFLRDDTRYLSWLTGEGYEKAWEDGWYTGYIHENIPAAAEK